MIRLKQTKLFAGICVWFALAAVFAVSGCDDAKKDNAATPTATGADGKPAPSATIPPEVQVGPPKAP